MYKKKHIIFAVIITFLLSGVLFNFAAEKYMGGFALSDPIVRARNLIISDYVKTLTDEEKTRLTDAAIDAMVKELSDPYSRYMSTKDFEEYVDDREESYTGIGISITYSEEDEALLVMSPYDNSPAQEAGVLPGDKIIKVNDKKVTKETYSEIVDFIKSETADKEEAIKLLIVRGEEEKEIEIKRATVDIQTVSYKTYGDIGYVRISQFINRTEQEFLAAIETLKDLEVAGVVIDVRNNPGGYAHTVIAICDMLLPEGNIAYLEDNKGEKKYFKSDENELGLPMAVLQNKGTASAAELLSGSLKAYGVAKVIGETSFGKAVGQAPYQLTESTALYLTNSRYFTPKGECIDGVGVKPDLELGLSDELLARLPLLSAEEDVQLQAALKILENRNISE